jgi:plasmid stabilization system protein ParE
MSYKLVITAAAEGQLAELDVWWDENRRAAARLTDELDRVSTLVGDNPRLPPVCQRLRSIEVRRVRLGVSPYYLYYTVDDERSEIVVLAFWSAMRGHGPDL